MLRFITNILEAHKHTKTLVDTSEEGEVPLQRLPARIRNYCGSMRQDDLERVLRMKGLRAPPINESLNLESTQLLLFAAKLARWHLVPFILRQKAGVRYLSSILGSYGIGRYRQQEALIVPAVVMTATHNCFHFQGEIPLPIIAEEDDDPQPTQ